jgi:hypothetical protein
MTRPPDFDDLLDGDLTPDEAARLRGVHDLLVASGPPPELPPYLEQLPPARSKPWTVRALPRRRWGIAIVGATALAAAAFGAGYLFGSPGFQRDRVVTMEPTAAAPDNAWASIELGEPDSTGNWPIVFRVRGLPEQPNRGAYYNLYLTREGRPIAICGTFRVHAGTTEIRMNAPYRLRRFDGWIVTEQPAGVHEPGRPVLRTTAA